MHLPIHMFLAGFMGVWGIASHAAVLETDTFRLTVNAAGQMVGLYDRAGSTEYAAPDQPSPLLQVRTAGNFRSPDRMSWDEQKQQMVLQFEAIQATIQVGVAPSHIHLELVDLAPMAAVDRIQWGPIATRIRQVVGEVTGVVRDRDYAIGLQILNPKTLGGFSLNDEGRDPSRGQTATLTDWGSTLQAYSMDRSRPRRVAAWGGHFPNMPVPPIPGETVIGSRIALFGCPSNQALERIGDIELAEGLPHPEFDGTWSRQNSNLARSYLIAEFTEQTIDEMLGYAKRGNFLSLYHGHPFQSWGHYSLRADHFPNGEAGMKACVQKAKALGLRLGVHTLTNFINTNDPYITPTPDPRLATTGSSSLVSELDASNTEIVVASPEYFDNDKANWMRTVMIDQELIRYGPISDQAPWRLLDCQRGAFGTTPAGHAQGSKVAKLMDHPYKVFFPNYAMQHEIAIRLAELFNRTGIGHFDFDGHEGCWASGQGDFALEMFAKVFYDHLDHPVHNGTSNSQPYYWHINTCCNWGEPWYGGFRSSMAEYRINNQAMLERNFMPKMLGWFLLTPDTSLADVEWLMARSAGYGSGFAMATSRESLGSNPRTGELLDTIREWEKLRMADAFAPDQRARMREANTEFHLEISAEGVPQLYACHASDPHRYEKTLRQPGEPTAAQWGFTNPGEKQPLQFMLTVQGDGGSISNPVFEIDGYIRLEVPLTIRSGQTLLCDATGSLRLYDAKGRQVQKQELAMPPPVVSGGRHQVEFSCDFGGDSTASVQVQFKALGKAEPVPGARSARELNGDLGIGSKAEIEEPVSSLEATWGTLLSRY